MHAYEALALAVDIIHCFVMVYWVGGFFISASRYPGFRKAHSWFGVAMFAAQVACGLRCPLTLVSGYLRELAQPPQGGASGSYDKPFVVELMKSIGLQVPDIAVTITVAVGTGFMIATLLHGRKRQTGART